MTFITAPDTLLTALLSASVKAAGKHFSLLKIPTLPLVYIMLELLCSMMLSSTGAAAPTRNATTLIHFWRYQAAQGACTTMGYATYRMAALFKKKYYLIQHKLYNLYNVDLFIMA